MCLLEEASPVLTRPISQSPSRNPFARTRQRREADGEVATLDGSLHELVAALALRSAEEIEERTIPVAPARSSAARMRNLLIAGDALAFVLAILVVELVVVRFREHDLVFFTLAAPALCLWILVARTYGLYDRQGNGPDRTIADDLPDLLLLTSVAAWFGTLFVNLADLAHPRPRVLVAFWLSLLLAMALVRAGVRLAGRVHAPLRERTLIVGAGRVGSLLGARIARRPHYRLDVVGFLDDDPLYEQELHLGGTRDLERVVRAYDVERLIIAFSPLGTDAQVALCRRALDLGVRVDIVPRMYEVIGARNRFHSVEGIPLVGLHALRLSPVQRVAKRALDLVVAVAMIVLLAPLLAYFSLRIKLSSPGPVLFRQERMGAGGKRFQIFKFRTMVADADARKSEVAHLNKHDEEGARMFKIADDPRITPFGRFLRKWSLDELPQLFNVVRGEMSLVGPRPLILDEDENIHGARRRRLALTPGITGLWQVIGRSDIPFAEMVTLDYLYVTNWSLWGDVKLLMRTVPVVLQRQGAY